MRIGASFLLSMALLWYMLSPLPGSYLAAALILLILYVNLVLMRLAQASLRAEAVQKAIEAERAAWQREVASERAQRIAAFARRDSSGELPKRCLMIVAVPRSGSTWLMDALRSLPCMHLEPSSIVFDSLALTGNRYPIGLSNGPDGIIDLELSAGRGATVPAFILPEASQAAARIGVGQTYAIEKIHPEFFDYDVDGILARVMQLAEGNVMSVEFVYQVRDPKAALASFLSYRKRDPTWYARLKDDNLVSYMERTYAALFEMACKQSGLVVDYSELVSGLEEVVLTICRRLWPDADHRMLHALAGAARDATSRDKREAALQTSFLGHKPGAISGAGEEYAPFLEQYAGQVDRCYEYYNSLLELRSRVGARCLGSPTGVL